MHDGHDLPAPEVEHTGPFAWYQNSPLYLRIVGALVLGILTGLKLGAVPLLQVVPALIVGLLRGKHVDLAGGLNGNHWAVQLAPFSSVVLRLLGALATPLIFVAVIRALVKAKISGRTGAKLILQLFMNTSVAIVIGLLVANTLQPGVHTHVDTQFSDPSRRRSIRSTICWGNCREACSSHYPKTTLLASSLSRWRWVRVCGKCGSRSRTSSSERSVIQLIEAFLDAGFRLIMVVLHWVLELIPFAVLCAGGLKRGQAWLAGVSAADLVRGGGAHCAGAPGHLLPPAAANGDLGEARRVPAGGRRGAVDRLLDGELGGDPAGHVPLHAG